MSNVKAANVAIAAAYLVNQGNCTTVDHILVSFTFTLICLSSASCHIFKDPHLNSDVTQPPLASQENPMLAGHFVVAQTDFFICREGKGISNFVLGNIHIQYFIIGSLSFLIRLD